MLSPNPFDISGQVALITGAGQGLGAGLARVFAQAGAKVVVHYGRSQAEAHTLTAEITKAGGQAVALQADVTQRESVENLIAQTVAQFGKVDILINNAGSYPLASVLEMTDAEWDAVLDSNLKSVFLCTQIAARQMVAQGGGGSVINIASIEAAHPAPNHSHYNAAKAGVVMHTRSAAFELGQQGIRVNCVSPGLIWREGIEQAWADGVERYLKAAPLGRLGLPEDIAHACLFLASSAASWMTGANLVVDGGVTVNKIF